MFKDFLILLIINSTIFISEFSQAISFNVGFRGGINFASIDGDSRKNVDKKPLIGIGLGVLLESETNSRFAWQVDALYNMKGVKYEGIRTYESPSGNVYIENIQESWQLSYLSFLLMGKLILVGQYNTWHAFFISGPEIGILFYAKRDGRNKADLMIPFESTMNFGVGFGFPIGSKSAFLEGRYGLGLTEVSDEYDYYMKNNNVLYLNLGIIL